MSAAGGLWQEARAPDGRVYYYNTQTKATQWSKPAEMSTPAGGGDASAASAWKEYSSNGRKYWHNADTNTTTWDMPDVLKNAQPQVQAQPAKVAAAPTFVAGGVTAYQDSYQNQNQDRERENHGYSNNRHHNNERSGYGHMNSHTDHDYTTAEEAEATFFKLLRKTGVQPDWSWEQTIKATIKEPAYRAIKDAKDRKAAFEKYVAEVRAQEKDNEKNRQAKLRADFFSMLRSHPEIRYYTRWNTARSIIDGETIFRAAKSEDEAQAIFNDYRADLLKSHYEEESIKRKSALDNLVELLQSLKLEPYTRWQEAQKTLTADERFQGDETFRTLTKIDLLKAFENHIKSLERTFNESRQRQKSTRARQERQNRDGFISLLNELRSAGKIKAGTKWSDIHPLVENDARYVAILGQSGSTPLDLFWDVLEEEDNLLRNKRNDALDVLEDQRYELTLKTTIDEFAHVMKSDQRTAQIDPDSMRQIFERLQEKVLRRSDQDRHNQRRAVDALRSRLKHMDPPILATDTWEQVRPRLEKLEEFRALDSDDLRIQAFDKHIRRQREKDEERSRRHSHHRSSRRHRSRTPETDAYEADRKRAQADRERQHRRGSGSFGLSPRRSSHYERERREREDQRVRDYMTRADPRDVSSASLDYGDSKPASSVRRRRESDGAGEARESKRVRGSGPSSRERTFSKSPKHNGAQNGNGVGNGKVEDDKMEDVAYKSGSEEGEIEEE